MPASGFSLKKETFVSLKGNTDRNANTLADMLLDYLQALGVEYVFGVPGGAIEPLYNALARSERQGGPLAVVARHEAGAAFMADGYSRATGKIGVCCATTGPGATNLITGVASAYENRIPLLVITAQTHSKNFGRGAFQESTDTALNIVGMFQFCTVYNSLVSHPEQLEQKLISALLAAHAERRPVHLSIPLDVFRSRPAESAKPNLQSLLQPRYPYDLEEAKVLAECLSMSRAPVLVIGEDCRDAMGAIMGVAERTGAALVTTPDAKSLVHPYHPNYRGVIGFAGHESAVAAIRDPAVDRVLLLGASMSEWCGGPIFEKLAQHKLVVVQEKNAYMNRSGAAGLHIQGNLKALFGRVEAELSAAGMVRKVPPAKTKRLAYHPAGYTLSHNWTNARVKPQWLMSQLPASFPAETEYLADTGNSTAWAIHYLHPEHLFASRHRHNFLQVTIEFAAMGWAIGAAVGTALARKTQPVVCITGDGSCLMNGQEMTVAQEYGLPVVFIILNDGYLGMVKHGQNLSGAEAIGPRLPAVDFAKMAAAMGIESHTIRCPEDWCRLNLATNWKRTGPLVLNVHIDPEEIPPIGMRINVLATGE